MLSSDTNDESDPITNLETVTESNKLSNASKHATSKRNKNKSGSAESDRKTCFEHLNKSTSMNDETDKESLKQNLVGVGVSTATKTKTKQAVFVKSKHKVSYRNVLIYMTTIK